MNSFFISYLFFINAFVSLISARDSQLKIISPSPNCNLQIGGLVNITVEIPVGSINDFKGVVLGFSLTLKSGDLHGTVLGQINTAQNPFSEKTGQLSYDLQIPAKEKLPSKSTSYFLAVYHMSSEVSNNAVLASVPITLTDRHNLTPDKRSADNSTAKAHKEIIQIPKDKLNASLHAEGHNTGDTIPEIVPSGGQDNNSVAVPNPSTSAANLTTTNHNSGASNVKPPSSGATRMGISAVLCPITTLSIFYAAF